MNQDDLVAGLPLQKLWLDANVHTINSHQYLLDGVPFTGANGATGATGQTGPPGTSAGVFYYKFSTASSGIPAAGFARLDNAVPASATTLTVANVDANGNDQAVLLASVSTLTRVVVQRSTNAAIAYSWDVGTISSSLSSTSYTLDPPLSIAGVLNNADDILLVFQLAGNPGPQGATGAVGPTGPPGDTGATGAGVAGAVGATGLEGATGLTGAPGATGFTGANGSTGPDGATGATGLVGATGSTGVAGANGSSASVFSYRFSTATAGLPGSGYVQLDNAVPAAATLVTANHFDRNGSDQSLLLASIIPGSQLIIQKAIDAAIFYSFTVTTVADGPGYVLYGVAAPIVIAGVLPNNENCLLVFRIVGQQGPTGPPGPPGAAGGVGATGQTGPGGALGGPGATGPDGATGIQGIQGIAGPPGTNGLDGATGLTGATGATGAGTTGATGADGATGVAGPPGGGSNVLISNVTTSSTFRPLFTNVASGATASTLNAAVNLTYNPGSGLLTVPLVTATTLSGALTGNASSATQVAATATTVASDRYLLFTPNSATTTAADVQMASAAAQVIKVAPNVPSLTVGATIGGTGVITCASFVGALTGNASSATQVAATATSVASDRYLLFTPNSATTTAAPIQMASAAAQAIKCNPSVPSLTLGAGVGGSGVITSNSFVGALTGNADTATQVSLTSTAVPGDRFLVFCPNATVGGLAFNPTASSVIKCNPSIPSLTLGTGVGGSGVITSGSFVGPLTGNASSSTQVFVQTSSVSSSRYLTMTLDNVSNTASTLITATQLSYNPGTQLLTVPNLTVSSVFTGTASTATNIAGGAAASIPYQSAAGTTAFLANGAVNSILTSRGGALSPQWSTPSSIVRGYTAPFSSGGIVAGYQYANSGMVGLVNVPVGSGVTTRFICPIAGSIEALTVLWGTGSATATVSIYKDAVAAYTSTASFTTPGSLAITSGVFVSTAAGSVIEVRTNTANLGNMTVLLYFT